VPRRERTSKVEIHMKMTNLYRFNHEKPILQSYV